MEFSPHPHCNSEKQLNVLGSSHDPNSNNKRKLNFYQPKSLFLITADFIVHHLEYVESLFTLPDIVGNEIFKVALQTKQFDRPEGCTKGLQLFTTAYKTMVLESLTIKESAPVLDEYYLELLLFVHLRELDVSSCNVDDNHSLLVHVGTQLCQLEKLILRNNLLTDKGIQTLTACSRMMGNGLCNLTFLDLSGNTAISDRVAAYMKCFHQLSALNLSNCNISESGKQQIAKLLDLTPYETSMHEKFDDDVTNKGWAAPLIDSWRRLTSLSHSHSGPSKSAEKFYSKKQSSPRKSKRAVIRYECLLFLRHDSLQAKLSLTEAASIESGTKSNISLKCCNKISHGGFETGIAAVGCKRKAGPFPKKSGSFPLRKRVKGQFKDWTRESSFNENLSAFYHDDKLYKKAADDGLEFTQCQRVTNSKRQVNPFVTKALRTKPGHFVSEFMDGSPIENSINFNYVPSNKDLTSDTMYKNSMLFKLEEDVNSDNTVEHLRMDHLDKDDKVLGYKKDANARGIVHCQVHKNNTQLSNRCQKTNLKHRKKILKIVKGSHSFESELVTGSENYSCSKINQSGPNRLKNKDVRRTSLFDFLE